MNETANHRRRTWNRKFADALRGLRRAVRSHSSFVVHLHSAAAVVAVAVLLHVSAQEWCLLLLAITSVLCAEALNTAIETLAAALHPEQHPGVGHALDIASGAVLLASIGATIVGATIFLPRLWSLL